MPLRKRSVLAAWLTGTAMLVACLDTSPDTVSDSATPYLQGVSAAAAPSVLWLGAHPDDETFAAPLLADLCVRGGATCHFAVITDGGAGNCQLPPEQCGFPDDGGAPPGSLGAQRVAEQAAVAAAFGGQLHALALEDSSSPYLAGAMVRWNQQLGATAAGTERVLAELDRILAATAPDVIFTFDPRHGMYCHPDHRAASALVIEAARRRAFDPSRIFMLESTSPYVDAQGRLTTRPWLPTDPELVRYDALAAGTQSATTAVMSLHRTQFSPAAVQLIASMAPEAWRLPWLPVSSAVVGGRFEPSAYDTICGAEPWNGRGVCPRADGSTGPCW